MTRSLSAVDSFLEHLQSQDPLSPATCRFQAAAELRVAMLHKLFALLACAEAPPAVVKDLNELCHTARELLTDVVVLYRGALAQAHGRAGDE